MVCAATIELFAERASSPANKDGVGPRRSSSDCRLFLTAGDPPEKAGLESQVSDVSWFNSYTSDTKTYCQIDCQGKVRLQTLADNLKAQ